MQTKLNSAFLLCLFFLSTVLCADDTIRRDSTLDMLKKEFPTIQYNQQKLLSPYEGHYVTKEYWTELEKTKSHPLSEAQKSYDINEYGLEIIFSYHEWLGYDCTFEKDGALWAYNGYRCYKLQINDQKQLFISVDSYHLQEFGSLPKAIPMDGPLIRVGKSRDDSAYFEKIFQHKCYTSDAGEKWCFGKKEITIDNKVHKVDLQLDMSEIPEYGNTLTFDDESGDDFFVFVPYENGWKIFQDTWMTTENHIPANPQTDKPWRILQ